MPSLQRDVGTLREEAAKKTAAGWVKKVLVARP